MKLEDKFVIHGNNTLIFRREGNKYITFDPVGLEYYDLNLIGAEICYCIAQGKLVSEILDILAKEYNVDKKILKEEVYNFILTFPCRESLKDKLSELGM